jgi:hypothetical protein
MNNYGILECCLADCLHNMQLPLQTVPDVLMIFPWTYIYNVILKAQYASEIHIFFNALEISNMCLIMNLVHILCLITEETCDKCAVMCHKSCKM